MQHRNSHLLVGYWSRLRRGRAVPNQSDIDPRAIKRMLASVFILDAEDAERPLYRLTGTQICDSYGYELKGSSFLNHWDANVRGAIGQLLRQALVTHQPVCLTALATVEGGAMVEIEIVLAPVGMGAGGVTRFIGLMQTPSDAQQSAKRAILSQRLTGAEMVREDQPRAISGEMNTGSAPEFATKPRVRADQRFHETPLRSSERGAKAPTPSTAHERRRSQHLRLIVCRPSPAREADLAERDAANPLSPRRGSRPRLICLNGGLQSA